MQPTPEVLWAMATICPSHPTEQASPTALGDLAKMQILIQEAWGGAQDSAYLISCQVMWSEDHTSSTKYNGIYLSTISEPPQDKKIPIVEMKKLRIPKTLQLVSYQPEPGICPLTPV